MHFEVIKTHLIPAELLLFLVVQAEKKWKRKGAESCKEREKSPGGVVFVCVSGQDGEEGGGEGWGRERKSFVSEWELVGKNNYVEIDFEGIVRERSSQTFLIREKEKGKKSIKDSFTQNPDVQIYVNESKILINKVNPNDKIIFLTCYENSLLAWWLQWETPSQHVSSIYCWSTVKTESNTSSVLNCPLGTNKVYWTEFFPSNIR